MENIDANVTKSHDNPLLIYYFPEFFVNISSAAHILLFGIFGD